jgi:hypothetical protein
MAYVPPPPHPRASDYRERVSAWVVQLLEPTLYQAVPALIDHPQAAGKVAQVTAQALINARGRDETDVPLSLSAVINRNLLDGLLPTDDIALLRNLQLDIRDAAGPAELKQRLERLDQVGPLPRHLVTE